MALFVMIGLSFQSCKDEEITFPNEDIEKNDPNGFTLSFKVKLDVQSSTRGWSLNENQGVNAEEYDNFIDTQDKFRVFFFTKEGEFLFGAIDRTISTGAVGGDNTQTYTVRIPMNVVVDRQGNEYPIEKLKSFLKNNEFKVAVLANWPNAGEKINPGDYDDSDVSQDFQQNPSSVLKGNPQWGFKNSVLYDPDGDDGYRKDKVGEKDVKNINDLHHLFNEQYIYADKNPVSTEIQSPSKFQCYEPFMSYITDNDGSQYYAMGEPTDWVKMRNIDEGWSADDGWDITDAQGKVTGRHAGYSRDAGVPDFDSKETANAWIRANWNPLKDPNEQKAIYRHYQHMWFLWNFDASYKYGLWDKNINLRLTAYKDYNLAYQDNFGWNNNSPAAITNPWGKEWYQRNGEKIYEWMHKSQDNSLLESMYIVVGAGTNNTFFTFNTIDGAYRTSITDQDGIRRYGIRLPSRGTELAGNTSPGTFVFQARTAGTIRIRWGNAHNSQPATLYLQKNREVVGKYTIAAGNLNKTFDLGGTNSDESFYDVTVGGADFPMYIYCASGDAIIYSIEFIRGRYLYDTDREGVLPDQQQAIPMYGVQDFNPINHWEVGSTEVITPKNDADFKLLRSLAKVIVYIPTSFGMPRHMYMRNFNRSARCEPMDVFHPINWADQTMDTDHPASCEFKTIMEHGPTYREDLRNTTPNIQPQEYRNWLSWFYGSWKDADSHWNVPQYTVNENGQWIVNESQITGYDFNEDKENKLTETFPEGPYPKIFNQYINRTEFCHFIYTGKTSDGGYYRYVLYVPEKYIDDPHLPGVWNSTPKVPHIEYRFTPTPLSSSDEEKSGFGSDDDQIAGADVGVTHSEYNLDDNDCFRIYFTNYGPEATSANIFYGRHNPVIGNIRGASYDNYEQNSENLMYHWPIMRNHTYEFYVGGSGPEHATVRVRISDWKREKVVVEW